MKMPIMSAWTAGPSRSHRARRMLHRKTSPNRCRLICMADCLSLYANCRTDESARVLVIACNLDKDSFSAAAAKPISDSWQWPTCRASLRGLRISLAAGPESTHAHWLKAMTDRRRENRPGTLQANSPAKSVVESIIRRVKTGRSKRQLCSRSATHRSGPATGHRRQSRSDTRGDEATCGGRISGNPTSERCASAAAHAPRNRKPLRCAGSFGGICRKSRGSAIRQSGLSSWYYQA